jgi:hypothetical protein
MPTPEKSGFDIPLQVSQTGFTSDRVRNHAVDLLMANMPTTHRSQNTLEIPVKVKLKAEKVPPKRNATDDVTE